MVMQSLSLYDTLTILKTEQPGIQLSAINAERFPDVTWDENNLVYKAAKLWFETYPSAEGVHIIVDKQIPSAAGLAGGSSDAAATLKGLNVLFEQGASLSELQALGIKLGADVPYCIQLGTALSEGIGEVLSELPPAPALYCVLVKPDKEISTKYIYEHLSLADAIHPDTDAMTDALTTRNIPALCANLQNILEPVATELCPEITGIKEEFLNLGALGTCMSGSGPTVFGLFSDGNLALEAAEHFKVQGYSETTFVTKFYQP
jgi:4-diphosphocytidyl-2-C-methyl-D-erythritol kinase